MNKLLLYLDNCCYNRPYDDQTYLSIYIETEAKLVIQELIKDGIFLLLWSFILDFENSENPDETIKQEIFSWRNIAANLINNNSIIVDKAKKLLNLGISRKDALHLSCAIEGNADYFITVDKKILKKSNLVDNIIICSPIDFINFIEA